MSENFRYTNDLFSKARKIMSSLFTMEFVFEM